MAISTSLTIRLTIMYDVHTAIISREQQIYIGAVCTGGISLVNNRNMVR